MVASFMVKSLVAQTWPVSVRAAVWPATPVMVMSRPPRMVPWNGVLGVAAAGLTVSVTSVATHQNTLHVLLLITVRFVVVKAAPISKFQGPLPVRLRVWSVNVNAAAAQWVPVPRLDDPPVNVSGVMES